MEARADGAGRQLSENLVGSYRADLGEGKKQSDDKSYGIGRASKTEPIGGQEEEDNGGISNKTSDLQAMMHILKANIAVGVLAMPSAFKNVGLWLGLILVPLIGATCIHCMNILIQCHNHLCDKFSYEALDYDQVAALGLACGPKPARRLAKRAHVIVITLLMFTQIGFCCVYILFVVENVQIAMSNLFQLEYSATSYMFMVFPVIWLTSCTSNLKHLAVISTLANFMQLTGLSLIFLDLVRSLQRDAGDPVIEVEPVVSFESILSGLPLFFATAVYAFEGIGVVLPVLKEMRFPDRISGVNGVLNTSMSLVAILYMGMGFFGYAKYGQFVKGSITFNLPESTLYDLVRLMFAAAIGLSYSLQFYVPWTIMWPYIDEGLFYSYKPREQRDKLDILNKLSADNEWAFLSGSGNGSIGEEESLETERSSEGEQGTKAASSRALLDHNSTATTFATSYTMSTYFQYSVQPASGARLPADTIKEAEPSASTMLVGSFDKRSHLQYGSTALEQQQQQQQVAVNRFQGSDVVRGQKRRNRFADVLEAEQGDEQMPDVEWRPPPKSMRGLRKLVRYTVILLTVSFTFVLAALIPQLDLFISLIGALASSCLAIVFPAIIQTCTFWNFHHDGPSPEEHHQQLEHQDLQEEASEQASRAQGNQPEPSRRWLRQQKRKRRAWYLFLAKNLLLIAFGFVGMITGSWISLVQLSAAYARLDSELNN